MKYKACNNIYMMSMCSFTMNILGMKYTAKELYFTLKSWFPVTQTAFMFGRSWLLLGEPNSFFPKQKPGVLLGLVWFRGCPL